MLPGLAIVVIFLVLAGLMMTRKMPALLALPIMAVAIGLVAGLAAGLPWSTTAGLGPVTRPPPSLQVYLFDTILTQGSFRLAQAMMYAVFGAILSQVVMRQGIAQRIVRVAAEYAGDRKLLLAFLMTAAISFAFTSLTGLGAVIMIGSLALPIMIGSGLSPSYASCLMLFAISVGGVFNPVNMGFYKDVLKLDLEFVSSFAAAYGALLCAVTLAFLVLAGMKERQRFAWALQDGDVPRAVPTVALITPLIPIALILIPGLHWPIIPAFLAGILFGLLTTEPARAIPNFTAAILEGLKDVAPVLGLFIGIGMTLNSMMDPIASGIMAGFVAAITPHTPLGYVAFFTVLAPLVLYRGPLNLFGLGAGFAALIMASHILPPAAVMAAFLGVGQIQGICDPTNTHNVWIAQFTHGSTEDYLRRTLPYAWIFVLIALLYAVFMRGVLS